MGEHTEIVTRQNRHRDLTRKSRELPPVIESDDDFEAMLEWLDNGLEASLDKDQSN